MGNVYADTSSPQVVQSTTSQDILASLMISVDNPRKIPRRSLLRILNISQDP